MIRLSIMFLIIMACVFKSVWEQVDDFYGAIDFAPSIVNSKTHLNARPWSSRWISFFTNLVSFFNEYCFTSPLWTSTCLDVGLRGGPLLGIWGQGHWDFYRHDLIGWTSWVKWVSRYSTDLLFRSSWTFGVLVHLLAWSKINIECWQACIYLFIYIYI